MQEAIPYKRWQTERQPFMNTRPSQTKPIPKSNTKTLHNETNNKGGGGGGSGGDLKHVVADNAVIVFSRSGCCMSHVVKLLLQGLGVNPAVYDVEEEHETKVISELKSVIGDGAAAGELQLPAVFIGGKMFGGLDRVMATHITGELVPVLKEARALWL